jgi:hypothetical protein
MAAGNGQRLIGVQITEGVGYVERMNREEVKF